MLPTKEGTSMLDLAEIFMRVSGDVNAVREHLNGRRVVEWSYLEDMALAMPETSTEHRCLMTTKGRDEIEKRRRFLLNSTDNNNDDLKMDID